MKYDCTIYFTYLTGRLSSGTNQTGDILINGRKERLAFGTSVRNCMGNEPFKILMNFSGCI